MSEDENHVQVVTEQPEAEQVEVADQQGDKQERNFRNLREKTERLERENLEKERIIAELQGNKNTKKSYFKGEPDDWATVGELSEYDNEVMKRVDQKILSIKYPNANELINKYGNEVNPSVARAIHDSGNFEAAMEAIKMTPGYIRDHAKEHINVARAMENASKPKSTLNVGSTGNVGGKSRYASMSREERMALQDRFVRGYSE